MSKKLSQRFEHSRGFDCSIYLDHGLQCPVNKSYYGVDAKPGYVASEFLDCHAQEWDVSRAEISVNTMTQNFTTDKAYQTDAPHEQFLDENYYDIAYNTLLKSVENGECFVPAPSQNVNKRQEIQRISLLADKAMSKENYNMSRNHVYRWQPSMNGDMRSELALKTIGTSRENSPCGSCGNLVNDIALKAIESPSQASADDFEKFLDKQLEGFGESPQPQNGVLTHETSFGRFQNLMKEEPQGYGDSSLKLLDDVNRKRRLCRHFVNGFCLRGGSCDFLHDHSVFCSDAQKVFLGGIPSHITPEILKSKLEEIGLTVRNYPRIMRGFCPQVCLGSVEEAKKFIALKNFYIDEHCLEIRAFQDKDQLRKIPSAARRSVFLGGLPENTTKEMIINDLKRLDIKVVELPIVKDGYAPRVVLKSVENAKLLIALKRVMVNGAVVDVRPYVNFRKRY